MRIKIISVLIYFVLFNNLINIKADDNKIIAKVENYIITQYDLMARIKVLEKLNNIKITEQTKKEILNQLIDDKVSLIQAKKLGVKITDSELEYYVRSIEQQRNLAQGTLFKSEYKSIIDHIKSDLLWKRIINLAGMPKFNVEEKEIDQFINAYTMPGEIQIAQLIIDNDLYNSKKSIIENGIKTIKNCDDFDHFAYKNGIDKPLRITAKPEELNEETRAVIANLNVGQVSGILDLVN
jgi:parvulin-like peptidyl-prolyl isomerase